MEAADFSGYATKAGLLCSDGRTIMPGAFKQQDQMKVPLVWQHGHAEPENVLGHAVLEYREDGVYAYAFFNDSPKAQHTRSLVEHGDITMLSIWANDLVERGKKVLHGAIREVSLVLSGANPGALIETVAIRHADGDETLIEDEAIIYTGLGIEHESLAHADDTEENPPEEKDDEVSHADGEEEGETVQDIYEAMSDKEKDVVHYLIAQALDTSISDVEDAKQSNVGEADEATISHDNSDKEGSDMGTSRNVFEQEGKEEGGSGHVLSHADVQGIVADATKRGSLREAVEGYAIAHGINQIDTLFPEATALTNAPEFFTRRQEWVQSVIGGARKSPFSRVKTHWADLTYDDARAKGYITGTEKQEEFYGTARRETNPQTIYKKQKLDRDDILDITDFDVVGWMKGEMRLMLDEEIARAVLLGDGRTLPDADKILEDRIRPIAKDDPLFAIQVACDFANIDNFVDAVIQWRSQYRGSGTPTLYTSEALLSSVLMLKDTLGRRIYNSVQEFATIIRVDKVVAVDIFDPAAGQPKAIMVNMNDYVIGSDKGGQVTLFDDFDIDFNQYKYLIETRISGALVKLKSALVFKQGTFVAPPGGTDHVIVPEPPNARQSVPPLHGSLPDDGTTTATEAKSTRKSSSD